MSLSPLGLVSLGLVSFARSYITTFLFTVSYINTLSRLGLVERQGGLHICNRKAMLSQKTPRDALVDCPLDCTRPHAVAENAPRTISPTY